MVDVEFLLPNGELVRASSDSGHESVMQVARRVGVPGILADCGGLMACATCHVYVESAWSAAVGPASAEEHEMIQMTALPRSESRLSCQIWLNKSANGETLNGLRVRVAGF